MYYEKNIINLYINIIYFEFNVTQNENIRRNCVAKCLSDSSYFAYQKKYISREGLTEM